MKFSDNILRTSVYVKREEKLMLKKHGEEASNKPPYPNLYGVDDIEKHGISKNSESGSLVHLWKIKAEDVLIGENIYTQQGEFLAYRSN